MKCIVLWLLAALPSASVHARTLWEFCQLAITDSRREVVLRPHRALAPPLLVSPQRFRQLKRLIKDLREASRFYEASDANDFYQRSWYKQKWDLALLEIQRLGISRNSRNESNSDPNLIGLAARLQKYEVGLSQILNYPDSPEAIFRFGLFLD